LMSVPVTIMSTVTAMRGIDTLDIMVDS
jgi:predicted secreted protein